MRKPWSVVLVWVLLPIQGSTGAWLDLTICVDLGSSGEEVVHHFHLTVKCCKVERSTVKRVCFAIHVGAVGKQ
jgi:hypothetical protein